MATRFMPAQPVLANNETVGTEHKALLRWAPLYARLAVGVTFLSSVGDRFGVFGPFGKRNVSWGDFQHFTAYTGMVNSFLPARIIPALAWAATALEIVFGVGLIAGIYKRFMAVGSSLLLLSFALAMTISFGIRSALDYSVYSASSAALLLFAMSEYNPRVKR
jgi:putative oxidoreductase